MTDLETAQEAGHGEYPGDYRTTALLKQSGRTSLYRGVRLSDRGPVVIKTIHPDRYTPADFDRLRSEYKVAKSLDGVPSVVQAHSLILLDGKPALVLEDFGGGSLDEILGAPLEMGRFLELAVSMAGALLDIHERNVVHRDIKPQNIIISAAGGEVKITDFGISRIVRPGASIPTLTGVIEGTLAYVSPEQTGRMNRAMDSRSDLYSLGVTFYQMLTGQLISDAQDALEWVHCHIARTIPAVRELVPETSETVSKIVQKLMAKLAEDRYQSALGLKYDLEKCLAQWRRSHRVESFALGSHDYSDRFQLAPKLYGRASELAPLLASFTRIADGARAEVLTVAGYSGIGKSSLVHELYKPIVQTRGLFLTGKFDQYQRHVPYATLLQAFQGLIQQVLSESEERLSAWRIRLQDSLGGTAGVIVQVIPELELIIGKQPPVSELGPAETQNRFSLAFQNFIRVFATAEHPLVIFLDDMQWADSATLQMLETLLSQPELGYLLLVLAYRDNETGPAHPFTQTLDKLAPGPTILTRVNLEPLGAGDLGQLVSDSLHRSLSDCDSLTRLILEKTGGNPFFAGEFLKSLYREGLIWFELKDRDWRWDEAQIKEKALAENVVDLLSRRLLSLAPATRKILALAACVGNVFDLDTLAVIYQGTIEAVESELDDALGEGLIIAVPRVTASAPASFRFQHDRIQQAAYQLIDRDAQKTTHLMIGRLLLQTGTPASLDRKVFDVVNQLNFGAELITAPEERKRVAHLNYDAGRKAKKSTAYAVAENYYLRAWEFLGEPAWASEFEFAFSLHRELAEAQYLAGDLGRAENSFGFLLARTRTDLERAGIYALQIQLYQVAGDYTRAFEISRQSFGELGLEVPASDAEAGIAIGQAATEAKNRLAGRAIDTLLEMPRLTDPRVRQLLSLLEASAPPVYMVRPALFAWVALTMTNLSLEHGNTESSCYAYGVYAILLAAVFDDVKSAYQFSQLAIRLNEKFDDPRLKGSVLHLLGDHVNFWVNPIATDLPILERGFRACVEGGDLIYSNYIAFQSIWHLWEKGDPLESILEYSKKSLAFAQQSKHQANYLSIRLEQQFLRALQGQLPRADRMSDATLDEVAVLAEIEAANYGCGVIYYHVMRMILSYSAGKYAEVLASAQAAEKSLASAFSMPTETAYWFFKALAHAALYDEADAGAGTDELRRQSHADAVRVVQAKFAKWAKNCPENFLAKNELLLGELARLAGQRFEALEHYENAMQSAHALNLMQYEALGCELAERVLRQGRMLSAAHAYAKRATDLYTRWGALPKVQALEGRIPSTLALAAEGRTGRGPGETISSTTTSTYAHQLDLISVVKASQHISSEIELSKLLKTLMGIVIQYAGADRGVLLLQEQGDWVLTAEAKGEEEPRVRNPAEAPWSTLQGALPESIVSYVKRTGERVILEDAQSRGQFTPDPYITRRQPQSLLCLPLSRHGGLVGLLYLENRLVSGVFNPERLTVLELLASQIVISIENSKLFKASQDAVHARDEFLSIASHELKTPLTVLRFQSQLTKKQMLRDEAATLTPERMRKFVDLTDRSVERLARLVEDMFDISKIATGHLDLRPERLDLAAVIKDEAERLKPLLEPYRCELDLDLVSGLVGSWDLSRLGQVVRNLLINAAKYGAGKAIHVQARAAEGGVLLAVRDEGLGIEKKDHERIFQRFERAISANEVSGMGLGLYICRRILAMHGGKIHVESEMGHGSTFTAWLPLDGNAHLGLG